MRPLSPLTLRAPKGRSSILHEALHDAGTAIGLAGFALAVIDLKRVLEIAQLSRGLAMVAQRRAAGLDGEIEHIMDGIDKMRGALGRLALLGRQCCGETAR